MEDEWLHGLRVLKLRSDQPTELEGIHEAQIHVSRAMAAVGRLLDGPEINPVASRRILGELSEKTMEALTNQPDGRLEGRRALGRALDILLATYCSPPSRNCPRNRTLEPATESG